MLAAAAAHGPVASLMKKPAPVYVNVATADAGSTRTTPRSRSDPTDNSARFMRPPRHVHDTDAKRRLQPCDQLAIGSSARCHACPDTGRHFLLAEVLRASQSS